MQRFTRPKAVKPPIVIYTDGACAPNPGPGSWAAIVCHPVTGDAEFSAFEAQTTNNRMELMGPIIALEAIDGSLDVMLFSDSQYVIRGITEWVKGWKQKGWRTATKQAVLNRDLWERLDKARGPHRISWVWVRGHNGHIGNERADALAGETLAKALGKSFVPKASYTTQITARPKRRNWRRK